MKRRTFFIIKNTYAGKYKTRKYYCWHSFTVATHLPWLVICSENLPWLFAAAICCGYLPWGFGVATCRDNLLQLFAVSIWRSYLPWKFAAAICCGNLSWLFAVVIFCGYLPWGFCKCRQILLCICEQILFIWKQTFFRCERNFFIYEIFFINDAHFCYCHGSYGPS